MGYIVTGIVGWDGQPTFHSLHPFKGARGRNRCPQRPTLGEWKERGTPPRHQLQGSPRLILTRVSHTRRDACTYAPRSPSIACRRQLIRVTRGERTHCRDETGRHGAVGGGDGEADTTQARTSARGGACRAYDTYAVATGGADAARVADAGGRTLAKRVAREAPTYIRLRGGGNTGGKQADRSRVAGGWIQTDARNGSGRAAAQTVVGQGSVSSRASPPSQGVSVCGDAAGGGGIKVATWNAERMDAKGFAGGTGTSHACRTKREWLEEYLEGASPDVLGITEVIANMKQLKGIRKWFRPKGYEVVLLSGEGGSRREPDVHSNTNAILVAVRRHAIQLVDYGRRAERVFGVEVRVKAERRLQRVCFIHGLHGVTKSSSDVAGEHPVRSFAFQITQAKEWLLEKGGGLLIGDLNKVPCSRWRASGTPLTDDDKLLRRCAGWRCACCPASDAGVDADAEVVGGGGVRDGVVFTHHSRTFTLSEGHGSEGESRIDYPVAFGADVGAWALGLQQVAAQGNGRLVSDHVLIEVTRVPQFDAGGGRSRRMPIKLGREGLAKATAEEYTDIVCSLRWQFNVDALVAEAIAAGRSAVEPLTAEMRSAGEAAYERAKRRSGLKHRHGQTASGDYNSWCKRLDAARRFRAQGASPFVSSQLLFHSRTGLAETRRRAVRSTCNWDEVWDRLVRRCRQQTRRAGKRRTRAGPAADDRRCVEEARRAPSDAEGAKNAALRIIKGGSVHAPMEAVHPGDDVSQTPVSCNTAEGRAEMGRIGAMFVESMDEHPDVEAFRAWCDVFLEHMPTLRGSDGGEWILRKELTLELFEEVLRKMPKRKGVGSSGWSVELLLAADANLRRMFYEAMMSDLEGKTLADSWRRVLYVLLVKPAPNDARRVSERREIALMAQEMKMLLQMVRRVSYARIVGRLAREQAGWLAGFGATDPAVAAALVIQQARRLGHPIWLLYVDLATFFPKINREVVAAAEILHGLPTEVVELATLIFGSHDQSQDAVRCQYDSAGGLSDEFGNYMGALMGCVLSPDKAKILLNSVLVAIQAVGKGVRLWGHRPQEQDAAWRAILQMCYADDHLAACSSEAELRNVWAIWQCWELVAGCKLGIKKKAKTVVTGVAYDDRCAPVKVKDPRLPHRDGSIVPFMQHDEAYKHLGVMRRADGNDAAAWQSIKRKFEGALRRLRKLRVPKHVSLDEFVEVSNMLMGGIANYYLQSVYITWAQAEFIERKWRAIYNRNAARCRSAPRAQLYTPVRAVGGYKGVSGRQHIYALGLSAVYAAFSKALGDVEDTTQRAGTRSALALAMETWGCRSNPLQWCWDDAANEIERFLEESPVKYLADAYMLACSRLGDGGKTGGAAATRRGPTCHWKLGCDSGLEGGPLDATARHFTHGGTPLLFEPVREGGLGLARSRWLVMAGVVEVGHMCVTARRDAAARDGGEWIQGYDDARKLNPRLSPCSAAREAWEAVRDALTATGVGPSTRVAVPHRMQHWTRQARVDEGGWGSACTAAPAETVDGEAVQRLVGRLQRHKQAGLPFGRTEWRMQIRKCFPHVVQVGAANWRHGGREHDAAAAGARILAVLDGNRTHVASGGEHRWLGRPDVGSDGFLRNWRRREQELRSEVFFDERGWPEWPSGVPVQEDEMSSLSIGTQLQCRARVALGDEVKITRSGCSTPMKRNETHVNLDVQQANKAELAIWCARVDPTAVYATDGTKQLHKNKEGKVVCTEASEGPVQTIARAAVRHDGKIVGGAFSETDRANTYIAEMAALIDAIRAEDDGGRLIFVFDATSPVRALLRYERLHARRKVSQYAGEMLDTLLRETRRHEVIVFVWQRSHVGSPVNEWADTAADEIAQCSNPMDGTGVLPLVCTASDAYSMADDRWQRGPFRWAVPRAQRFVLERLRETVVNTALPAEDDFEYGAVPDGYRAVLDTVLARRAQIGDERRYTGAMARNMAASAGCPAGCKHSDGSPCLFTYDHVAFFCQHVELRPLRQRWAEKLLGLRDLLEKPGVPDKSMLNALRLLRPKQFPVSKNAYGAPTGDGRLACDDEDQRRIERGLRRITGGRYTAPSGRAGGAAGAAVGAAREAAAAGAILQIAARRLTSDTAQAIRDAGREQALGRKYGRRWRTRVVAGGPERIAALAHVDDVRHRVAAMIADLPTGRWRYAVDRLKVAIAAEAAVVRMRHHRHRRDLATAWWVGWRCLRWHAIAVRHHAIDQYTSLRALTCGLPWRRRRLAGAHVRSLAGAVGAVERDQARAAAERARRARDNRSRGGFGTLERARAQADGKDTLAHLREFMQRQQRRRLADHKRHWQHINGSTEGESRPAIIDAVASKVATAVLLEPTDVHARDTAMEDTERRMPNVWFVAGCRCKERAGGCTCGAVAMGVSACWRGTETSARRALKGWLMSGGVPEVQRERRGEVLLQQRMRILRQAASFARYFKSHNHSCSGAPLMPVGEHIRWQRTRKQAHRPGRERARLNEYVAKGRAADRSNRWTCSLWRVCFKRGARGRRGPLMALVRWKDARWWPTWKRAFAPAGQKQGLSEALREEARALKGALLRGMACRSGASTARKAAQPREGSRHSSRLAYFPEAKRARLGADGCSDATTRLRGCEMDDDEEMTIDEWLALDGGGMAIGDGVRHNSGSEGEDEGMSSSEDESAVADGADAAFDAEKVCGVRRKGTLQALVEWSGSNGGVPWARSWEPLENLGPGLQQEAMAIWEKRKAARRKRGGRRGPSAGDTAEASAAHARAEAVTATQRKARNARAERGRKRGGKGGGNGPTTRKRGRGRGD